MARDGQGYPRRAARHDDDDDMDANETDGEKAWQQLHKNATSNIEQVLEATSHKAADIRPPTTHHENYQI